MARPQQPWLHEYDITVDGPLTVVSERGGDLGPPGTGIMFDDRRVVRTLHLLLDDVPCVPVASSAVGAVAEHWTAARHLGDPGPDPTVEVHRRRAIDGHTVTETITVRSRHAAALSTTVTMFADGDGAEMALIKAEPGRRRRRCATKPETSLGWSDERHGTAITAQPSPAEVVAPPDGGLGLRWPVTLAPHGAVDDRRDVVLRAPPGRRASMPTPAPAPPTGIRSRWPARRPTRASPTWCASV